MCPLEISIYVNAIRRLVRCPACSSPSTSPTWTRRSASTRRCSTPSRPRSGPATPTSPSPTRPSSWSSSRTLARCRGRSTTSGSRWSPLKRLPPPRSALRRPGWRPRSRTKSRAATPCRTRCGSTVPAGNRGSSIPCWPTWRCPLVNSMPTTLSGRCAALAASEPRAAGVVMEKHPLWRRLLAEGLGSAFLAAVVIGSGIAAQQLSPGDPGLELLENAVATGSGLFAIILMFGPISGAHINPVVSVVDAAFGGLSWWDAAAYLPTQVAGCTLGAIVANVMFAVSAVSVSTKHRASGPHFLSEVVATLGLLLVIFALARTGRSRSAPAALGAYIGAAYFFTSSTSFANPAITVGRMFSNTFAGVAPSSAPTFIAAQIVGAALAVVVIKVLYPTLTPAEAADIIVPHAEATSTNGTVVPANTALAKEAP